MNDLTDFDHEKLVTRLLGNEALAQRVIRRFVDDMPGQIASLAQAVQHADSQSLRQAAHSVVGAAAIVSGEEIRRLASTLEQNGKEGDLSTSLSTLQELTTSFERAKVSMEVFCRQVPRS